MRLFIALLVITAVLAYALGRFIDSVADSAGRRNWPISRENR